MAHLKAKQFPCPYCGKKNLTTIPSKSLAGLRGYWELMHTCNHCDKYFFLKIWSNGEIKINKLLVHQQSRKITISEID
jgi:transcription elongation factor Elf1